MVQDAREQDKTLISSYERINMNSTKLYVLEWDYWAIEGVFRSKKKAKKNQRHYLETIREVTVIGEIIDNKVFIGIDGKGDWVEIHTTEKEANDRLHKIPFEHEYEVKEVTIIT